MDNSDIRRLYEEYAFLIHRRCLRILGDRDDAWDATQTVFLRLIQHVGRIRNRESIVPWIYRTAVNHCFNVLRSRRKIGAYADPELMPDRHNAQARLEARSTIEHLLSMHDRKVRDAVYYTYVEGLEQREIQKLTGQSPATVRRHLAKFRRSAEKTRKRLET